jgi:hypothetical protein
MPEFRIVPDGPMAFAVQVLFPGTRVEVVRGFPTEAAAQAWADEQQARDAAAGDLRPPLQS